MPPLTQAEKIAAAAHHSHARHLKNGGKAAIPQPARSLPVLKLCANEGPIIEPCPSCKGDGRHVRACSVWKEVTWEPVGSAKMNCQKCKAEGLGYVEPPPVVKIIIPTPPPLDLAPTSDRAIVTVAVGEEAKRLLAVSGPYMAAYARRLKADFVVLDWPGHPLWPMSAKFAIPRTLDWYKRIAYVDADVLLRPGCLDLFRACNEDEMGMVDELFHHRLQPKHGREAATKAFRREMGFAPLDHLPFMCNAGVMVVPASHKHLLTPPTQAITPHHCAEQDHTGAMLLDSGLPYRLMDRRLNWQSWTDPGFQSAPREAVLHWSGSGQARVSREDQMRQWAERHPFFDPPAPSHEWEIDRRHALWLSDVLLSGRYKDVLEIGSFRGYSTRAFLHALDAGSIREFQVCETNPTPELRELVGDRAIINTCASLELLRHSDFYGGWDLVLLDGDHSPEVVVEEARLLIAQGCPAVFAHDTSHMDGPSRLRSLFEGAGYICEEDNAVRPGERTERGMLLATKSRNGT